MVKDTLGIKAKRSLELFVEKIDRRLVSYWDTELGRNFGFNLGQKQLVKKILEHSKEHNLRTGKRLRGSFVYYAYQLGKEMDERIWQAAMSVELVHTALLMHDDFMDQDRVRRGKPTTHVLFSDGDDHYGDCMAVNIGDAVLCLGYQMLLGCGFENEKTHKALDQLLRGIANTAYGQAYDVSLPKLGKLKSDEVISLHKAKTAIYTYENPLFIGGILAGLDNGVLQILKDYSMTGGVAFQLQDDVLGVFGNEEKTGKSADSDLRQGKVTLLISKALELGNEKQVESILRIWGKRDAGEKEIDNLKRVIMDTGSYEYSVVESQKLAKEAAEIVSSIRNKNVNLDAVDYLEGIARYMVEREM